MGLSGTAIVLLTSFLALPISYGVNLVPKVAEYHLGIFAIGVVTLLIVFVIPYIHGRDKKRRKDSMYFVWSIFTFASVIDFVIALENDDIVHNFMMFYMLGGEPYLKSAHGSMINYFDGTVHFAMYLLILTAIDHLQSYRDVGLYWAGSITNSVIVLCFGSIIDQWPLQTEKYSGCSYKNIEGKYGVRWSVLLNVPYLTLPIWVAYRLLTGPKMAMVKSKGGSGSRNVAMQRAIDVFFILYFVFAIIMYTFNVSAALDCKAGVTQNYLTNFAPYLKDPIAFPKVQMLVYFFYFIPFCVFAIHSLLFSRCGQWLYDWSLIHAGAAANAQFAYMGAQFHSFTPYPLRVPETFEARLSFWIINSVLFIIPQLFAYYCYRKFGQYSREVEEEKSKLTPEREREPMEVGNSYNLRKRTGGKKRNDQHLK